MYWSYLADVQRLNVLMDWHITVIAELKYPSSAYRSISLVHQEDHSVTLSRHSDAMPALRKSTIDFLINSCILRYANDGALISLAPTIAYALSCWVSASWLQLCLAQQYTIALSCWVSVAKLQLCLTVLFTSNWNRNVWKSLCTSRQWRCRLVRWCLTVVALKQ